MGGGGGGNYDVEEFDHGPAPVFSPQLTLAADCGGAAARGSALALGGPGLSVSMDLPLTLPLRLAFLPTPGQLCSPSTCCHHNILEPLPEHPL
jgi:hypothetical protein